MKLTKKDRFLTTLPKLNNLTSSGLIVNDYSSYNEVTVIVPDKVGKLKKGDVIHVLKSSGIHLRNKGDDYFLLELKDVISII